MSKRTAPPGQASNVVRSASGALTAGSLLVVSGVAAAVGVVIAREFGRGPQTDGLLVAYGVFIVIAISAQAIRIAVLPALARAKDEDRLAGELVGFALALAAIAAPLVLVTELAASWIATVLTGDGSGVAHDTAEEALRWVVPAGCLYLFAGIAASGLAALDDYALAALGYAAGALSGLTLILLRADPDGIIAIAWGMTLNGTISLLVPLIGLAVRAAAGADAAPCGPPYGPAATRALRDVPRRSRASARPPAALRRLPPVCEPRGRGGGDELRLRVPRRVGSRHRDRRVARPRDLRPALEIGSRPEGQRAPYRGRVVDLARGRRCGLRGLRARGRRRGRARARWRVRRRGRRRAGSSHRAPRAVDHRLGRHLARVPADVRDGQNTRPALDRCLPRSSCRCRSRGSAPRRSSSTASRLPSGSRQLLVCIALLRELGVLADSGRALVVAALTIGAIARRLVRGAVAPTRIRRRGCARRRRLRRAARDHPSARARRRLAVPPRSRLASTSAAAACGRARGRDGSRTRASWSRRPRVARAAGTRSSSGPSRRARPRRSAACPRAACGCTPCGS